MMKHTYNGKLQLFVPDWCEFVRVGIPQVGESYRPLRRTGSGDSIKIADSSIKCVNVIVTNQDYEWPSCITPGTWLYTLEGHWCISANEPKKVSCGYTSTDGCYFMVPTGVNIPMPPLKMGENRKLQKPRSSSVERGVSFDYWLPEDKEPVRICHIGDMTAGEKYLPLVGEQGSTNCFVMGDYVVIVKDRVKVKWPSCIKAGIWAYINFCGELKLSSTEPTESKLCVGKDRWTSPAGFTWDNKIMEHFELPDNVTKAQKME